VSASQPAMQVGDLLPSREFAVNRQDLVRYAGASGDFNPIHWNREAAVDIGLPDVIAHGMFTMALAGRVVTDWLADPGAIIDYSVRFTRPVVVSADAPTTITVTGVIATVTDDGQASIDLKASVDGQTVLTRARVTVRTGPGR
jgi:acyl dehydratase